MKLFLSFRFWFITAVLFGMAGCGYTTQSALPARLKTIFVEPFINSIDYTADGDRQIYFPLLEVKVRNAVIDRFLFDGNLRVTEKDQADLVLSGELVRYERYALRYTDNDDVQEYRVHVIVNLVMKDRRHNEVLWEESGFAGEATYFVSGALATTESSALEEATVDLARRVVERTIENW
ncbi:MAG TPA: LPS assembly lipoprotein LptE [Candidatus Omnitrophota bacterium]|jgi:hypothetical protein|nr:LPS assembly lipoprotein LptE [Candidatus Omnitrophota bacterium]HPN55563.1 LPS assembly lipoprotein LptE [Candidatus Omnitrophota bacterium]